MSSSKDNLNEFFSSTSGKAGSALLLIFLIISTFVVFTYPLDFGTTVWNNPAYCQITQSLHLLLGLLYSMMMNLNMQNI